MSISRGRARPEVFSVFFDPVSATPRSCHAPLTVGSAPPSATGLRTGHDRCPYHVGGSRTYLIHVLEEEAEMAGKPPQGDPVQDAPQVSEPQHAAAGLPAIGHTLRMAQRQM